MGDTGADAPGARLRDQLGHLVVVGHGAVFVGDVGRGAGKPVGALVVDTDLSRAETQVQHAQRLPRDNFFSHQLPGLDPDDIQLHAGLHGGVRTGADVVLIGQRDVQLVQHLGHGRPGALGHDGLVAQVDGDHLCAGDQHLSAVCSGGDGQLVVVQQRPAAGLQRGARVQLRRVDDLVPVPVGDCDGVAVAGQKERGQRRAERQQTERRAAGVDRVAREKLIDSP